MKLISRVFAALALVVFTAIPGLAANDDQIVNVSLWDKGSDAMANFDMDTVLGTGTPAAELANAPMGITIDKTTVNAGDVTFKVTNDSKDLEHEMIVAPIADPSKPLPYDKDVARLDEDALGALGEVSETEPGGSGSLTLKLNPGEYILFCNIENHYAMGMWTLLTVK